MHWSRSRGRHGGANAPCVPSVPTATMGCCCSSDYDEDWIENIDICEHCNYPIEPDSKRQVRRGWQSPTPVAKHPQTPAGVAKSLTLRAHGVPVPWQGLIRNGSEVRDPLVTYESSSPPCSPMQGEARLWLWGGCDTPKLVTATPVPLFVPSDKLVVALYNYEPKHDGDLGLRKGEKLRVLEE